jgi:hypothetical protein
VCKSLSLFRQYYNIRNVAFDGMLVVENVPITGSLSDPLYTVFPLKTKLDMLNNEIDGLFTTASVTIQLNSFIKENALCIVFDNVILFAEPISIHSNFNHFVTPQFVSVGLLHPFTEHYTLLSATQSDIAIGDSTSSPSPVIEGLEVNTLGKTVLDKNVTCKASDDTNGMDISKIAMVPVDSDFLNGVYQISMMRTLFDIFIFIFLLIVSIFVSPPLYHYLVVKFTIKYNANRAEFTKIMHFLNILFALLFLMIGLFFTIDGASTKNGTEMVFGIYFTLVLLFSMCAIRYYVVNVWKEMSGVFSTPSFTTVIDFMNFLRKHNFITYLLVTFTAVLFVIFMLWIIYTFVLKNRGGISWLSILFVVGPVVAVISSYIVIAVKELNTPTLPTGPPTGPHTGSNPT